MAQMANLQIRAKLGLLPSAARVCQSRAAIALHWDSMGRRVPHPASLFAVLLLCTSAAWSQNAAVQFAAAAIQRGDFPAAEKTLRAEVATHPGNSWALSLLGVALDNQKKLPEAEEFHRRAAAASPVSAEILNNYGTHRCSAGQAARPQ